MKLPSDFLARAPFRTDTFVKSPFASLGDMPASATASAGMPAHNAGGTCLRPGVTSISERPEAIQPAGFLAGHKLRDVDACRPRQIADARADDFDPCFCPAWRLASPFRASYRRRSAAQSSGRSSCSTPRRQYSRLCCAASHSGTCIRTRRIKPRAVFGATDRPKTVASPLCSLPPAGPSPELDRRPAAALPSSNQSTRSISSLVQIPCRAQTADFDCLKEGLGVAARKAAGRTTPVHPRGQRRLLLRIKMLRIKGDHAAA